MLFYFDLNGRFEALLEIANYNRLIGVFDKIELCKDKLKILKVRCPVSGFFSLVLRVFPELTLDIVNKDLEISKVFFNKSFEIRLRNKSDALMTTLVLSSFKANSTTEK